MAWLSDWAKRIEITVDNTNIDSDLTHFPIPIVLGTAVGQSSDDVSAVFDELTSDANRKKIAVTKDDGTTQIYVEIERWDDANEEAVLWVSKSDLELSSSGASTLYLYYDSTKADNTTYVGDTTDAVAQNVWDGNYTYVSHDGGMTDSVGSNSGTDNCDATGNDGLLGNGKEFDGNGDHVALNSTITLSSGGDWTLEFAYYMQAGSSSHRIFGNNDSTSTDFQRKDDDDVYLQHDGGSALNLGPADFSADEDRWVCGVLYNSSGTIYYEQDASAKGNASQGTDFSLNDWGGGHANKQNENLDGFLDELRVSDVARSAAWRKANYYAQTDNLLTFGTEEEQVATVTAYKIYGEVRVKSVLSNRPVRIYNRSTGNLVAKANSVGGSYEVSNQEDGTHISGEFVSGELISGEYYYAVCVSNVSGEYSSDIIDKVKPEQYTI